MTLPRNLEGRQRGWWLFLIGLASVYLLIAHRAHLSALGQWLPFVVLLACPLIHVFGHHRHHAHAQRDHGPAKPDRTTF